MNKRIIVSAIAGLGMAGCCFGGGGAAAAPISLGPGFTPDPNTATGSAGGVSDASTFGAGCLGHISLTPNHTLTVSGQIPYMRIVANAAEDITLVVRRPDGTYMCNDDTEGYNPMVEGAFPPGNYDVFVGSYSSEGQFASYRIGFSANQATQPSTIGAP